MMSLFHVFELSPGRRRKKDTGSNYLSVGSHFRSSSNTLPLSSPWHNRGASKYRIDVQKAPTSVADGNQEPETEDTEDMTRNDLECLPPEEVINEKERLRRLLEGFFWSRSVEPLDLFQKIVKRVQLLLKISALARRNNNLTDSKNLSFAQYQHELLKTRRTVYGNGLSFDPLVFKAHRETMVPPEVRAILSMDPPSRSEEQLHTALVGLEQCIEAFGEFPIMMQRSLVKVGWYEFFESKRIIIRQGHTADNFYFILSGTALVTIFAKDEITGEERSRTVASLGRGNSFGELALMHKAKRSATVTCKDDVELLAVGRDDFVDIFMHVEKDKEPHHIRFLRTIPVLRGWPIDMLPYDNPKICLLTYFRRGVVMCRSSHTAEWVYIIKTGHCRVLKSLDTTEPSVPGLQQLPYAPKEDTPCISTYKSNMRIRKGQGSKPLASSTSTTDLTLQIQELLAPHTPRKPEKHAMTSLPALIKKPGNAEEEDEKHKRQLEKIFQERHPSPDTSDSESERRRRRYRKQSEDKSKPSKVFVQIQKLGARDTFNLESVVFSSESENGPPPEEGSFSLVSDGSEAILISKKYFLQHASEEFSKKLRTTIRPYPSEDSLQQKLQDKTNWEAYKTMAVQDHVDFSKFVHDTLYL